MNVHTKQIIKYDAKLIKQICLDNIISMLKKSHPNIIFDKKGVGYLDDAYGTKGDNLMIQTQGAKKGTFYNFEDRKQAGDILRFYAIFFYLEHDFYSNLKRITEYFSEYFYEYLNITQSETKLLSDTEKKAIKARQEQSRLQAIEAEKQEQLEKQTKTDKALELWNDAICINHPTAQAYLQARGLNIAFNMHVMRYLPKAWHSELKMNLPCLIALVRTTHGTPYIQSNGQPLIGQNGQPILEFKPIGIERHYLPPEPQTTPEAYKQWFTDRGISRRLMLGSKKGGVIKLNDSYKDKLVLCEGLFDALTLLFHGRELGILSDTETPNVYAFLGINNLADITIPDRYKEVYLLADNDSAGLNSIELLKNNHSLKGRTDVKIEIFKTNSHKDLNELWLSKLKEKARTVRPERA